MAKFSVRGGLFVWNGTVGSVISQLQGPQFNALTLRGKTVLHYRKVFRRKDFAHSGFSITVLLTLV